MERITLNNIKKSENKLWYDFSVSEVLTPFFSNREFEIEYPFDVSEIPDAIAAVPFVCNVLPIVWLTDSELVLDEIDKEFYECISNVKKGYETMFPESVFAGSVNAKRIIACDRPAAGKSAAFFSGGLDAVNTLVMHLEESPDLISIWGSDIRYENVSGWEKVHNGIEEYCRKYQLKDSVIRSTFREFDNESALHERFSPTLKDGWWHGVKHGIGLLGHAAPYAYLHGLSTVYIASSNCPADGPVRCASNPLIDNHVRFANCRVVHDGFEFSRQDKVRNVVEYSRKTGEFLPLHVCWETQEGGNCCKCEKCYRTIAAILAEGANPVDFNFLAVSKTLHQMQIRMIAWGHLSDFLAKSQWIHIHNRMVDNKEELRKRPEWKYIKWIYEADFTRFDTVKMPIGYRIRSKLSQFKFYQLLSRIKKNYE